MSLSERNALVTGGSRGIGAGVALELASHGCDVALTYRGRADAAAEVAGRIEASGRRALALQADVGDFARAEQVVAEVDATLGGLDILVCNAGITWDGVIWKMSER